MQLQEAKENFLKELNRRDPGWADKVRQKKLEDIQKLESAKNMLSQEIQLRERQIIDDKLQDERLGRLKTDYTQEKEKLADLVREDAKRKSHMESEISQTQKQLNAIRVEAAQIEEKKDLNTMTSEKKPENVTLSPEQTQAAPQFNPNKGILRGEGYYSSNNSNNVPVSNVPAEKPTKQEPQKVEPQLPIYE